MPYTENLPARSIPLRALFGKLSRKVSSLASSISSIPNTDKIAEAGENVTAGNAARLFTDGKAYQSTPLNSDNKYAQWFFVDTVTAGNNVKLRRYGEIPSTNTLTINGPVYLVVSAGGINISQNPITEKSPTSDLWQYLGYATTANTIAIEIKLPELFT